MILGVDPGAKGGLALVSFKSGQPELVASTVMPSQFNVVKGKKRHKVDLYECARWVDNYASRIKCCIFEDVGAMPAQGVTSMFSFGRSAGGLEGVIAANFIPIHYVRPQKWKRWHRLSQDKNASLELARDTFGLEHFPRKKDEGVAEAALMCLWAKDQLHGVAL